MRATDPAASMRTLAAALIAVLGVLAGGFRAAAQEASGPRRLRDQAEFAIVDTSGNSDVLTLSLKNRLEYDFTGSLTGTWGLTALYGEQDGVKNAERYTTDLRLDHLVAEQTYVYLLSGWLRDRFAGFDDRYHMGPGVGRKLLIGPTHFLKAEVGVNWTREDYTDGNSEDFFEGRGYGQYDLRISEGNALVQRIEYLVDFEDGDNYKIITETAVISALTKLLAIKIAYEVRYQNRPVPATLERTDTVFSASLVVSY